MRERERERQRGERQREMGGGCSVDGNFTWGKRRTAPVLGFRDNQGLNNEDNERENKQTNPISSYIFAEVVLVLG